MDVWTDHFPGPSPLLIEYSSRTCRTNALELQSEQRAAVKSESGGEACTGKRCHAVVEEAARLRRSASREAALEALESDARANASLQMQAGAAEEAEHRARVAVHKIHFKSLRGHGGGGGPHLVN